MNPLDANADTPVTPHEVGLQSAQEAFPGGAVGSMVGALLVWGAEALGHPMGELVGPAVTGGCAALGAWLSSYLLARRRA